MSSSTPRIHPYLGLALGVLAVAAAAIIVRLAQQIQVPSFVIAAYRLTFASLILAPLALTRYRAELATLNNTDYAWAGITGLCLGLHFAAWFTSLEYTTVASSAVFVTTAPLFVALFSAVVWRERLGWVVSLGLIIAIMGGGLIGVADVCRLGAAGLTCPALGDFVQGRAFIGDGLATLGAIGFAAYMLIGRRLRSKLSLIPYIFLAYSAAALTLIVTVILAGQSFVGYSPAAYIWLGLLALVPQLIGHSAFNWALRYVPATFVTITTLGEPLGSTVLAWFFFQEIPTPLKLLGGGLILLGIVLASKR